MNELKDIPAFLWPTMLYPLDLCFRESGENAENKSGRREGVPNEEDSPRRVACRADHTAGGYADPQAPYGVN